MKRLVLILHLMLVAISVSCHAEQQSEIGRFQEQEVPSEIFASRPDDADSLYCGRMDAVSIKAPLLVDIYTTGVVRPLTEDENDDNSLTLHVNLFTTK